MFKYSFSLLERTWNTIASFWDVLPSTSQNKKIEKFHIMEEKFVLNFVGKHKKNIRILDLGLGTGRVLKLLSKKGFVNLVGIDLSAKMIENARKELPKSATLLHIDFREKFPFEDDYFDLILIMGNTLTSGGLLESERVLRNAHRVLKKTGTLIIGSYNSKFMTREFVDSYYGRFPKEFGFKKFDNKKKTVYFGQIFSHWVKSSEIVKMAKNSKLKVEKIREKGIGLITIVKKL